MTDYLSKPFSSDDLFAIIKKYAGKHSKTNDSLPASSRANLNQITEGNPVYKKELVRLLVDNLQELKTALTISLQTKQPEVFNKASHKTSTTIGILKIDDLTKAIEEIKVHLNTPSSKDLPIEKIDTFELLIGKATNGLKSELT
jgi:DNA-binding response OmpR family regulator